MQSDTRALIRRAKKAGWTCKALGSGHLELRSPGGERVVVTTTRTDFRGFRNMKQCLKRAGLRV